MFIGRDSELENLNKKFDTKKAQLVVMYGRRRIGKSALIKKFSIGKNCLYFEGLENQDTAMQIESLLHDFSEQTSIKHYAKLNFTKWTEVFDLLTEYINIQKNRTIIVFDELQWIARGQTKFISLFKKYWDQKWKNSNTMIILCGSVAHFMVKKVVKSKALYGRTNLEIRLMGLKPSDSRKLLKGRGAFEVLKYLMIFGGVPKYLEEINQSQSLASYLNDACFKKESILINEVEKIFFSQFKEARTYRRIVELLVQRNLSLAEISKITKIPSGGGLQSYLENLELAGFIRSYSSLHQKGNRNRKYKLFDEYLIFYYKFIKPSQKIIEENDSQQLFLNLVEPKWTPWLGIAFETFCLKNAFYIAEKAGFAHEVISYAPYFSAHDSKFQVDLVYKRKTNIWTVCEIKFFNKPISAAIISEMERKIELLPTTNKITVEKMLISPFGADQGLRESQYFHHIITMDELF